MEGKVLEVNNLTKTYGSKGFQTKVLKGISLSICERDFIAIMGPSGSGKTTLLNMLSTIDKPTHGSVILDGKDITKIHNKELSKIRRDKVGFIFQSFNLLGTMNAIENVALPLTFRGVDKKIREAKAVEMLKLVGLPKHMKHRPNEMSGGQQQRVGVARALVLDPEIIFADEPTGNLDSKTSAEVLGLMRKVVTEKNQTMVMVTHDNHLAGFADRIFHIIDGKIVKIEDRSEYKEDEQ